MKILLLTKVRKLIALSMDFHFELVCILLHKGLDYFIRLIEVQALVDNALQDALNARSEFSDIAHRLSYFCRL